MHYEGISFFVRFYIVEITAPQMGIKDSYEVYAKSSVTAINRVLKEQAEKYQYLSSFDVSVFLVD